MTVLSSGFRRHFSGLLVISLAIVLIAGCRSREEPPRRIFLITIDTLRADHLSCRGYPRQVSPFIDRLAARGVLFTQAFASSSTTVACHASLFTSLHPPQHQMIRNGEKMDESLFTMAELLRQRGFVTAGFSTVNFMKTLAKGFGEFDTEQRYFPASHVVDKAWRWLAERDPAEQLFIWLHLFDVHEWYKPRNVDKKFHQIAAGLSPGGKEVIEYLRREHGMLAESFSGRSQLPDAVNAYDGQLMAVDAAIERFFNRVLENGLNEHALWIITADHGEGLGSHGFLGHGGRIYNEQLRVPLIFYFADERYGSLWIDRLVRHVDVFPTLGDMLGATLDRQIFPVAGHSLLPLMQNRGRRFPAEYSYSQRREADEFRLSKGWEEGDVFSIQTLRHKYIYHSEGDDEFYDLLKDPLERKNRIAEPHEIKDRMRAYVMEMQRRMNKQGSALKRGEINPEYFEELKALGYL